MGNFLRELVLLPLTLFNSVLRLIGDFRLLLLSAAPVLIGILAFSSLVGVVYSYRDEAVRAIWVPPWPWLETIFGWLFFLAGGALAGVFSLIAMLAFGGVFIEFLVERALRLEKNILPEDRTFSELAFVSLRLIAQTLVRAALLTLINIAVLLLSFFPPLLILVFIVNAAVWALNLSDQISVLQEQPLGRRLRIQFEHLPYLLPLGALLTLCTFIPFLAFFALPVVSIASVQVLAKRGRIETAN